MRNDELIKLLLEELTFEHNMKKRINIPINPLDTTHHAFLDGYCYGLRIAMDIVFETRTE